MSAVPAPPRRLHALPGVVLAALLGVVPGALLAGTPAPAGAQTVRGIVMDHETGAPLAGVALTLRRADAVVASALSNDRGAFTLTARPPAPGADEGELRLTAGLPGYAAVDQALQVPPDDPLVVEIRMAVDPIEIQEPVVVVAEPGNADIAGFHRRRERGERSGFGNFIYGEELDRRAGARPSELVRTVPGVRLAYQPVGAGSLIQMRGGCLPALYIDGILINRFQRAESLDTYVSTQSIEGIEVYKGAAQPGGRFHDPAGCGLVMVWTRRGVDAGGKGFSWGRVALALGLLAVLFAIQ